MKGRISCLRWKHCSAAVCPLADDWQRHQHIDGERICGWLYELAKDGGEARLRQALPSNAVDRLATVSPALYSRWYAIRKRLREAARSGSRMEAGHRLSLIKAGGIVATTAPQCRQLASLAALAAPRGDAQHGAG